MKFSQYAKAFVTTMLNAVEQHNTNAALHDARIQTDSSAAKAAKNERTNAKSANDCATLSEAALKLAHEFSIDALKLESSSRENIKRTIAALNAIASSVTLRKTDSALDAALCYMSTKNTRELSHRIVMREAQHDTTTQAQYLLTFFQSIDAVEVCTKDSDTKDKRYTLKSDSAMLNAMLALYTVKA